MKAAADKTTHSTSGKNPPLLRTFGVDFLDTTWRIVVPVTLFALAGIWGDRSFGTAPWLTLLSVLAGFVCAGLLIKRQLDGVKGQS